MDTNEVRLLGGSAGVSEHELNEIAVAPGPDGTGIWIYQVGKSDRVFNRMRERVGMYVQARLDGHTKECLAAGAGAKGKIPGSSDPDLRTLAANRPLLPPSWLRKGESGTFTNSAGVAVGRAITYSFSNGKVATNSSSRTPEADESCRWTSFTLVDGQVAWRYVVTYKADGALDRIDESKFDAREVDPSTEVVIHQVEREVAAEMKAKGTSGRPGSIHTFWKLKKDRLKAKGIEWRSPAELNPDENFD
jgi:hypothetical protein